jgi:WD40 repeat protein
LAVAARLISQPEGDLVFARVARGYRTWGPGGYDWSLDLNRFWHRRTGQRWVEPFVTLGDVVFQPDGRRFAILSELRIYDSNDGSVIRALPPIKAHIRIDRNAWSQDGKFIAAVSEVGHEKLEGLNREIVTDSDGTAHIFAVDEERIYTFPAKRGHWRCFTPWLGGDNVISGGEDGLIRIHRIATGKEIARWQAHDAAVTALALSPDETLLVSGARDGSIRVWNLPWIRQELAKLGLDWE